MRKKSLTVFATLFTLSLSRAMPARADAMQYAFPIGQELTYQTSDDFKYDGGEMGGTGTATITVLAHNPDGTAKLLVRPAESRSRSTAGAATQPSEPEQISYSVLNISPLGRANFSPDDLRGSVPPMLPPLPANSAEAQSGWTQDSHLPGETTSYTLTPASQHDCVIHEDVSGLFAKIYGMKSQSTVHFNLDKGYVTSVEGSTAQNYGFHGVGTDRVTFVSEKNVPRDELDAMAKDADTYLSAKTAYWNKMQEIDKSPEEADKISTDAKAILESAQSIQSPELKSQISEMLDMHDRAVTEGTQEAKANAARANKPAPALSASLIDGQSFDLSAQKGKVVVLDFWYRGCGWCIRSMPQMKQLTEDLKGKPVVIAGVNVDRDVNDAKFVVDAMGLNYLTILSNFQQAGTFSVHVYPTLLIIDQQGMIHKVHTGYSATLKDDLEKDINELLANKAG